MKKIIFVSLLAGVLMACDNDETGRFDVNIDQSQFTFEPIEGAAVMRFRIDDPRVYRIQAEYNDGYGEPVTKMESFSADSMILDGFHSAASNVRVTVKMLNEKNEESKEVNMSFNTKESALYSVFENMEVIPYWDGFSVKYNIDGYVDGFANVYFVGINPTTNLRDTILMETFRLVTGGEIKGFILSEDQFNDTNTVVVTTEDFKQRIARRKVWTGIGTMERVLMPNSNFELLDPFGLSIEEDYGSGNSGRKFGTKFLFDGDKKGEQCLTNILPGYVTSFYTFLAGPDAISDEENEVYFVLDIKTSTHVGEIRLYTLYQSVKASVSTNNPYDMGANLYFLKLPCHVVVAGCDDYDPVTNTGSWTELGEFEQDPSTPIKDRWYNDPLLVHNDFKGEFDYAPNITSMEDLNSRAPIFFSIPILFDGNAYRYFRIEVKSCFEFNFFYQNTLRYITFHELEVFAKKD